MSGGWALISLSFQLHELAGWLCHAVTLSNSRIPNNCVTTLFATSFCHTYLFAWFILQCCKMKKWRKILNWQEQDREQEQDLSPFCKLLHLKECKFGLDIVSIYKSLPYLGCFYNSMHYLSSNCVLKSSHMKLVLVAVNACWRELALALIMCFIWVK